MIVILSVLAKDLASMAVKLSGPNVLTKLTGNSPCHSPTLYLLSLLGSLFIVIARLDRATRKRLLPLKKLSFGNRKVSLDLPRILPL
jgi:hypothetical protein